MATCPAVEELNVMNRLIFSSGLAVGYVLGARAGRARYEAIARVARRVRDRPEVQTTAGVLQAQATAFARSAMHRAPDVVDAVSSARWN